uniref:Signal recognition particle subunit SRP72 n=2 Tax=Oncorhynchus TaxID=8016 RepID=A0A8C7I5V1_ONCKI
MFVFVNAWGFLTCFVFFRYSCDSINPEEAHFASGYSFACRRNMSSGGGSVASLWTEVNRCGQNGDFTRALKAVNKILHEVKEDVTALHCKIVCLVQNCSFKEALNVMNTYSKVLGSELIVFEKAYCEYRLNRVESALKTIESVSEQTDKLKELYGQVLYRMERYDECKAVYTDLIRNSQDEYEEERKTNLSAVVAAMSTWEKASPDDLGLSETTYELSYNAACTLIGRGQLTEALNKLQEAEELCRVFFSEDSDITEEDVESELAVIHSQMAYIMQLQGRTEEALQLYNQVIKLKPSDVGLLAVTANNIITINKDQNVFDSKKKVKLTNADGVEYKLAKKQLQAIEFNKALLAMYTNQADQCRKLTSGLQSQNPGHPRPVLIQVAQLCREKQHSKAIELLQRFSDQHPDSASGIKLTMAQLYLTQGHVTKACDILRSIEDFKHKQGMISALVSMYSHEEDIDSAIDVFSQAIQYYQSEQPGSSVHLALVREAADFKLKYGRKKEAISDLEQLWKQNTNDIHTLAQLISAYSLVDQDKAKSLSKHLPSPESMSFNVDVDELENSHGANYVRKKAAKVTGENPPKEQGQGDVKKKKKKKKKGKLPKNYDPTANPDPERWLPMRERTYYRGRKKGKKKEQVGKGTQGATSGAASDLDASKTASSPPTSPRPGSAQASASTSAPAASNVVPPRQQKPATAGPGARKKAPQKKKKGSKSGW